ncbi:hypothetical protein FB446DRAFT_835830 [Lentinula raphanica]|nr:hypothetical protein FB446DRAFT_835830 [Lentinula raphanica]
MATGLGNAAVWRSVTPSRTSSQMENSFGSFIVKAQIVLLLSTLTEDNHEQNQLEIRSLSEQHGIDTYLHFIRRLIAHSHARLSSNNNSTAFDASISLTFRLLLQEIQRLARDPYLAERFRDGVDRGEGEVFRRFDFIRFVDRVGLRPLERLVLAAPIVSSPVRKEFSAQAQTVLKQEFKNAILSLCHSPSFDLADFFPNANLNWATVIKSFDVPDRHGVDTPTLKLLIAILLGCSRDANPHPVTGFWTIWSNALYQLRLLDALLSLPGDTFNLVQLPGRRVVTVEDVAIASPTIESLAANVQGHTWNSLDLFEVLVKLADSESTEIRGVVREMLDKAIKISAELVHMGLLQVSMYGCNEKENVTSCNIYAEEAGSDVEMAAANEDAVEEEEREEQSLEEKAMYMWQTVKDAMKE